MTPQNWTLDDIPWHRFDPARVEPRIRWVVEATCLVESRADLYSAYVADVLAADPDAVATIAQWGEEEAQHGDALRRWLEHAAPAFDFDTQNRKFRDNVPYYELDGRSVRGSVQNELLCRCVVESLASAYYRAIHDATTEPALRATCDRLARDEARHFRMFVQLLERARKRAGRNGLLRNLWVVYRRVRDLENDQVAFAFHCFDERRDAHYNTRIAAALFLPAVYGLYRVHHIDYALRLIVRALGLHLPRSVTRAVSGAAWIVTRVRAWYLNGVARRAVGVTTRTSRSKHRSAGVADIS